MSPHDSLVHYITDYGIDDFIHPLNEVEKLTDEGTELGKLLNVPEIFFECGERMSKERLAGETIRLRLESIYGLERISRFLNTRKRRGR